MTKKLSFDKKGSSRSTSKEKGAKTFFSNTKILNFNDLTSRNSFNTPLTLSKKEKPLFVMKKDINLNMTERKTPAKPVNSKIQFIKLDSNIKSNNDNKKIPTASNKMKNFLNSESSKSSNPPPPKEENHMFTADANDFACCTINNLESVLLKVKEFCDNKGIEIKEVINTIYYRWEIISSIYL
jgi:hypothetical protein